MPYPSRNLHAGTSMSAPTTPSTPFLPSLDSHSSAPSSPPSSVPSPNGGRSLHVKRPKNPFILFRCDFVKRGVVPASVERDHRNISRIAGRTWHLMTPEQKRPWELLAAREKADHARMYPDYKYKPSSRATSSRIPPAEGRRAQRRARAEDDRCQELAQIAVQLRDGENVAHLLGGSDGPGGENAPPRRRSSCPPVPSAAANQALLHAAPVDPNFFIHRDDLFRPNWSMGMQPHLNPQDLSVGPFDHAPVVQPQQRMYPALGFPLPGPDRGSYLPDAQEFGVMDATPDFVGYVNESGGYMPIQLPCDFVPGPFSLHVPSSSGFPESGGGYFDASLSLAYHAPPLDLPNVASEAYNGVDPNVVLGSNTAFDPTSPTGCHLQFADETLHSQRTSEAPLRSTVDSQFFVHSSASLDDDALAYEAISADSFPGPLRTPEPCVKQETTVEYLYTDSTDYPVGSSQTFPSGGYDQTETSSSSLESWNVVHSTSGAMGEHGNGPFDLAHEPSDTSTA